MNFSFLALFVVWFAGVTPDFLKILENLENLEFLENPQSVENKGDSGHSLEILENLEILMILEISPVKRPLSRAHAKGVVLSTRRVSAF